MELLEHTPNFDQSTAEHLARELYALDATAALLPSERDQNFRLSASDGGQFVLKISNGLEDREFLDAQNLILVHLEQAGIDFCPRLVPTKDGDPIATVHRSTNHEHLIRLVSFLPGKPLANVARQSSALHYDLGHKLGLLDAALAGFDHPGAHREFHWDLALGLEIVAQHRHLVAEPAQAALIDKLLVDINENLVPLLSQLRQSVIHSDANDHNVIVGTIAPDRAASNAKQSDSVDAIYSRDQTVTGIIDFGDMVYSYTVGNLAIAAAYAMLEQKDPVAVAAEIVRGYHAAYPLTDAEISALWGFINLRLSVSVCLAAVQMAGRPDDEYLAISQAPIRNTMPKLAKMSYGMATAIFRHACGLEPIPTARKVIDWIQQQTFAPILGRDLSQEATITLDLSIGSPLLHGDTGQNRETILTPKIFALMATQNVQVSIGRYNEPRLIYTDPMFDTGSGPLDERRTIHIALDLFAEVATTIYAPLAGTVHAAGYADGPQDYGGVIMLKHQIDSRECFYTLYGHLSRESVERLQQGERIEAGEELARMGPPAENGDWPPHLHLQLILDDFGLGLDFPGVGLASQREIWRALCPDPNLLVGIPAARMTTAENDFESTFAVRKEKVGRNLSLGYRKPLKIVRGWQQYLWDHEGRKYLDAYNNVPHVGHCHPHVVAAGQRQMAVLNTNTRYLHDFLNQYAERLTATLPDPLNVCYFVNSASEANELALRMMWAHTGRKDLIVNEGAYHGHTSRLIDISPYKHDGPGGEGAPDWVHTAPIADVYRGAYRTDDPLAAQKYANAVQAIIAGLQVGGKGLAGFIAETCPSVGGQIILPDGYLAAVYDFVRAAGGLAIADEVQTGYGRVGSHFYAFEAHGVVPDIVVLGKPIGNGHPIGALITTAEIADSFNNGMEFFSTFGGNAVSCAIGMAVLDVLAEEGLQAQAHHVGQRMLDRMGTLVDQYEIVGDVRGAGLFQGIELVRNRQTLEPAAAEASFISNRLREMGILVGTDGPLHNVVKIRPPMPFDEANADFLVDALDHLLRADFRSDE